MYKPFMTGLAASVRYGSEADLAELIWDVR